MEILDKCRAIAYNSAEKLEKLRIFARKNKILILFSLLEVICV